MQQRNHAIYISPHNPPPVSSYPHTSQLYQTFTQITRTMARKNNLTSSQVLSQYLNQCNKGEHVVLKSYSSFSKCILNRQCFLFNFWKIFQMDTNLRNGIDYYQLFRLLCSDFPKEIVTGAIRIMEGGHQKMMEVLLNSQKMLNSLYITFIYSQFLQTLLQKIFQNNPSTESPLLHILSHIQSQYKSPSTPSSSRPPLQIIYQIILNYLSQNNHIKIRGLTFLTEDNIHDFIVNCVGENKNNVCLSYDLLLKMLVENKQHQKFVGRCVFWFENGSAWANQAAKVLNIKEGEVQQPLNSKKMKKK